jgi:hypothetical protein
MVLVSMRIINKIFFVFILAFLISCEDQGVIIKCPDCLKDEPVNTDLSIKLDGQFFGQATLITVYEGNLEDSVIYTTLTTGYADATVNVSLNKKYTLTATYYKSDNYYITVDSATPKVRYDKTQCDDPCYFVYDKSIDLRLKYSK